MKIIKKIIVLLILIIILLILLLFINTKNDKIIEEPIKIKDINETVIEETPITEKTEINLIIEKYITYKKHPRLLQLGLNRLQFNSNFFKIKTIKSKIDYDSDGIDDYLDILEGAIIYTDKKPYYISEYYEGGYPTVNKGVCTDVIWNALENAGYNLKNLVDEDISQNPKLYPLPEGYPDPNIDFRRVINLETYFSRYCESLTTDTSKINQWQQGDIVVYSFSHIGICSNLRNYKGIPYLIHNGGRTPAGTYNVLESKYISSHFRIKFKNT